MQFLHSHKLCHLHCASLLYLHLGWCRWYLTHHPHAARQSAHLLARTMRLRLRNFVLVTFPSQSSKCPNAHSQQSYGHQIQTLAYRQTGRVHRNSWWNDLAQSPKSHRCWLCVLHPRNIANLASVPFVMSPRRIRTFGSPMTYPTNAPWLATFQCGCSPSP